MRQFLSATLGVACFPEDGLYPEALLAQADMALHKAKSEGKRSFRFYDPALQEEVVKSRELENHLRDALEAGELEVFFQPQVGVASGRVEALEALARWHSPTLGQISPGRFIPVAERSGLIVPLGALVLREACRFAAGLEAQGLPVLVRAPLVHYYYEVIHPFWDGNGRVGRVLEAALLLRSAPGAVFRAFCDSRLSGDWGYSFGTLGAGVNLDAILARALPA